MVAKAETAEELLNNAETIGGALVSTLESDSDDDDEYKKFNHTQGFNTDAQALAQELLASYKWEVFF